MTYFIYLDSNKSIKKLVQNDTGLIPIGIPKSYLKTMPLIVKKHL